MTDQDYTFSYDGVSADLSPQAIKAAALDSMDFLWGTVKGNFNSKMSLGQIILDAAIGMIPLVGEVTAARDVVSIVIGMVNHPSKRKEVMEWVLMVIFLLALIPVAGGLAKGAGRLVFQGTKTGAKEAHTLAKIIETLNRAGFGSAKKFIQELDLLKHQRAILQKFNNLMGDFISLFDKILVRLNRVLSPEMKQRVAQMRDGVKAIKELGSSMIPKAVKELNAELKKVQKAIYSGEWHTIPSSGKAVTREAEARLAKRTGRLESCPEVSVSPRW